MFFLLDVKDGGYNVSSSSISQAPSSNPHWLTKFSRLYNKIDDQNCTHKNAITAVYFC